MQLLSYYWYDDLNPIFYNISSVSNSSVMKLKGSTIKVGRK